MKPTFFTALTGLSLILFILGSCRWQNPGDLTADEKKTISGEIETVVRKFLDAKTLSYETEVGLRANVDGYVCGGDGKIMFTSFDEFDKGVKKSFTRVKKFTECEIPSLYIYVLSKDAATCTFQLKSKFLHASGDTVVHNACWTMVFKKFDKEWKVIQENGMHTKN